MLNTDFPSPGAAMTAYLINWNKYNPNHILVQDFFDTIISTDPYHMAFANLAASEGEGWIGSCKDYNEFLDLVQNKLRPPVWCYDFYPIYSYLNTHNPIQTDSGVYLNETYNRKCRLQDFYKYLEIFRNRSKQSERPFWTFCGTQQHANLNGLGTVVQGIPAPTINELRFEAFSALAYGAQGIVYWRYANGGNSWGKQVAWKPTEDQIDKDPIYAYTLNEDMLLAPINEYGDKTYMWYVVQQINKEIAEYNDIFFECEVLKVLHTPINLSASTGAIPEYIRFDAGYQTPDEKQVMSDAKVTIISEAYNCVKSASAEGIGIMLSWIKSKEGTTYLVIVSHDPFYSQKIYVQLQGTYNFKIISISVH